MKYVLFSIVIAAVLFNVACTGVTVKQEFGDHDLSWSYDGEKGPENWGGLKDEYVRCKTGGSQSPINLTNEKEMGLSPIEFNYVLWKNPKIENDGHTIRVENTSRSYIVIAGKPYQLMQLHFHSPSEHQIDGVHLDMEMHLVHKSPDDGQIAVVAVLFTQGEENKFLKPLWGELSENMGGTKVKGFVDLNTLLPEGRGFLSYSGSLTTPPCSENVSWSVMSETVSLSPSQLNKFTSLFGSNARPIQATNGRAIGLIE